MTWQGERAEVPEFGLLFPLRRELTEVSYQGLGHRETTADRTAGGKMGAWNYNVRQDFAQNSPVYPQDCGSRTGVYSATVTGSGLNIGIGFAGDGMTFSALPYTPHELENARHLYELPRDDNKRSSAALLSSAAWAATTAGAQSPMQTPALRWRREPRSVLRFKNKNLLG